MSMNLLLFIPNLGISDRRLSELDRKDIIRET